MIREVPGILQIALVPDALCAFRNQQYFSILTRAAAGGIQPDTNRCLWDCLRRKQ